MPPRTGERPTYTPEQALQFFVKIWDKDVEFLFAALEGYRAKLAGKISEEQRTKLKQFVATAEAVIETLNLVDPSQTTEEEAVR